MFHVPCTDAQVDIFRFLETLYSLQVLLEDMSVKSLKQDNMREVQTGAVVRLKGLQSAPELNGKLGECGTLDLATSRYTVTLVL